MARQARLSLTGQVHHVLWRGNGREQVFIDALDRELFTALLVQHAQAQGVAVHAWALMPDHVHLLLTPQRDGALSLCLQAVGRAYVQAFNRRHVRRGTLWEGRFRSTVLEPETWLLRAMVWLDTHPQRLADGMGRWAGAALQGDAGVADAAQGNHPWVTAGHYLGHSVIKGLTPPPQYWALGNTPFAREAAYRTLLAHGCGASHQAVLAEAALKGWVLGSSAFVAGLQQDTERRLQKKRPGRPVSSAAQRDKNLS